MKRYDIIAIGGGAAGLVTAAGAAGLGARAALIERARLGGECLWTGCVPSKALLAAAKAVADARHAARYGIDFDAPRIDFARVMAHVHAAQQTIAPHDSPARFRGLGVDVYEGAGTLAGSHTVLVNGEEIQGRHIVVATGSRPAMPAIPGLADVPVLTNENIFEMGVLPASLLVLGGGAVGIELAQACALLGSRVTLLEVDDRILRSEDAEIAELLHARLARDGVAIHTGAKIEQAARTSEGVRLTTSHSSFEAAALLVAAGRRANTDTLGLEQTSVEVGDNGLKLDKYLETTSKNIWAAGDVTGAPRFTHVADYQARLVLRNALFPGRKAADYSQVPWAIYTQPELAHVGLTEAEARDRYGSGVQVWRKSLAELDRGVADGLAEGMVKLVADARGRLLGGHAIGPHASTMLGEIALAMKQHVTLSALSSVMHAYPTYPEALKQLGDAYQRTRFKGLGKWLANRLVRR
jgi:pyruvate/2-oxoglutarate dehydrogenase complex dihydrolipoamide dehydrogenase (E3) component